MPSALSAFIGSWLLPRLGVHVGTGMASHIAVATAGAVILLIALGLLQRGRGWGFAPRRRFWRW